MTNDNINQEARTYNCTYKSFDDTLELSIDDPDEVEIFGYDIADQTWLFFDETEPGHLSGFTLRQATRLLTDFNLKTEFLQILGDEAVVTLRGMIRERRSHSLTIEIPLIKEEVNSMQVARLALHQRLTTANS